MTTLHRFSLRISAALSMASIVTVSTVAPVMTWAASGATEAPATTPVKTSLQPGSASSARRPLLVDEIQLWRRDPLLQQIAKRLNPLGTPPGDGSLGLNRRFPEKVLVQHQTDGWMWIRIGAALRNTFIIDRGIMAFEWAFARMTTEGPDQGSFGESNTVEVAHFLGLYARSVLLLRAGRFEEQAKRLERLTPRLEVSLRSPRSLLGEKRWDAAEKQHWVTPQRLRATAAAFWIGKLLANPALKKTADLWLDDALRRQEATGLFPSGLGEKSKALARSQLESLESLQGLAWADAGYALKLREPIAKGFKWLEAGKTPAVGVPITYATYAAWSKNVWAANQARRALTNIGPVKAPAAPNLRSPAKK